MRGEESTSGAAWRSRWVWFEEKQRQAEFLFLVDGFSFSKAKDWSIENSAYVDV